MTGIAAPTSIVIGAGVVGVTIAYRLAQAGVDVAVVDAGDIAGGTTGATFAQANASYLGYWDYFDLRRAGLQGYERFREEFGLTPWWYNVGTLNVYTTGDDFTAQDAHLARLQELGFPAERIEGNATDIEPGLASFNTERIYRFPSEGWVDAPAMVADIAKRASRLGVTFLTGDAVTGITVDGRRVTAVRLSSGQTLSADQIIVCGGRWTDDILALTGYDSRFVAQDEAAGTPVPGLLVISDRADGSISGVTSVDDVSYRPHSDGRTMVWSPTEDYQLIEVGGLNASGDDAERLARSLLERAAEFVPALRSASVQDVLVTARAMPADGLPIVGRPFGLTNAYIVLAHAAVTLAPALADLVVAETVGGRTERALDRFRPDRFVTAASSTLTTE